MKKNRQSNWRKRFMNIGLSGLLISGLSLPAQNGYGQALVTADFTGQTLPAGWSNVDNISSGQTWEFDNPGGQTISGGTPGFDTDFAILDSDNYGSGSGQDASLETPAFNAATVTGAIFLSFDNQFQEWSASTADVDVWNGSSWVNVLEMTGVDDGFPTANHKKIDITTACGGASAAKVRFRYVGNYAYWWAIDNVEITEISCVAPTGLSTSGGSTANSVTLSWLSATVTPGNGYEYYYNTTGTAPTASTPASGSATDTSVALTGLTSSTLYYAWVRSVCSASDRSDWSTSSISFYPSPANDECANAVLLSVNPDLSCGSTTHGTITGATSSGGSSCSGTADDDVWYKFTATDTMHTISLNNITGSASDMMMELLDGCGGASLACSDPESFIASGLTVGNTYYLRVYTYYGDPNQTSEFDVCVGTFPPPPANDECVNAVTLTVNPDLTCGSTTHGTVASATSSGGSSCSGTADDDVWYKFTATDTMHTISLNNITGSDDDMMMELLDGCGGASLECSDPESFTASGLTVGNTYYLRVYTYYGDPNQTSEFDVCVGTIVPPANDDCAAATDISDGLEISGNLTSATESMPVGNCGSGTANDVWYSVTPVASGSLTITADPDVADIVLAIDSGACNTLTELDCADNSYYTETVTFNAVAGETYYVRVYGYNGEEGLFTIQASGVVLPVTLGKLKGRLNSDQQAELSWKTFSESGNRGFKVQRSKNGADFYSVGYIPSQAKDGETYAMLNYQFTDVKPVVQTTYYRLAQEDINGRITYSKVIAINANETYGQLFLTAHPNPVRQGVVTIAIHGTMSNNGHIIVTNLLGRTVATYTVQNNRYQINMEKLPAGMYLIKYADQSNSSVIKVVKE